MSSSSGDRHQPIIEANGGTNPRSVGLTYLLPPTRPVDAALALACGSLLSDSISAAGEVDQHTFSVQAGERVTLTLTASGFPLGATAAATVFSPTAAVVVTFNANSQQQLTLAESGTYVIQVQANNFVSTGSYSLGLECLLPTSPVDATLACGTLLSSRPINASGQVDQITFSGQTNERKTLTLTAAAFPTFVTATATVFSPTAAVVITFNANNQQQLTLAESGTYVIQVRASNLVSTGSYSLGLECLLPTSPVDATLACGSLFSDSIGAAGEVDQITFSGQANERKTLTLTASGFPTFVTARATVFSPTAAVVVTFDANSQQQLTLPESGTYVIQVRASDLVSTGAYSIGLECLLPTSPVDATLACGTLLSSRPINASGQVDQITFSGQTNERKTLTLTAAAFPTFVTATATVFSPTAAVVITFNANNQQQLTLAESGTYVIQVRASNLVSTGSYSLGLQCLPSNPTFTISGRVVDASGPAISNVTVNLTVLGGGQPATTQTDASGNYSFTNVQGGSNYLVAPSSSSYSFSPASQTFNNLDVNRIANFVGTQSIVSITGQVTDSNNAGLSNVTLALTKNGTPAGTVLTDALGNYTFGNLAAGATYVVTPAGSFTPSSQTFNNLTVNANANFKAVPTIPPQCNTVSFGQATNFAAGSLPASVAVGDFNSDGKPDLVVANFNSSNVSVLLSDGAGGFTPATNFAVGTNPGSVAVGDFNGDGKLDLAVANSNSNNVSVLLGNGAGSFGPATNFAAGTGPSSLTVADFDDDERLDLAVTNAQSGSVSVLLGNGAGSFGAATNFTVAAFPISVAVSDFNNDGRLDLVVVNRDSNNVSVLLGNGPGSFAPSTNFAVGTNPGSVATGDFNGDGKSDLAVTNSGNVSVLLGNGAGSFAPATNFAAGGAVSVAVGDFNGDAKLDLAVANQSLNNASVLLGNGDGSFVTATNFVVGTQPVSVAVGDFNGDAKLDLAVANSTSANVSLLLSNGPTCNTATGLSIFGRIADAKNDALADVTLTLSGPITRVVQTDAGGNYSFANLVPGGNYALTVQNTYYIFAPSRADFFNLSTSRTLDLVAAPIAVPSPTPPANDDFGGAARDPDKWSFGTQTQPAGAVSAQVNVRQVNNRLVISPAPQASGMQFNGYVSANAFDLRNGTATVEVVRAATEGADTIFAVGSDGGNFARFMVRGAGGPSPLASRVAGLEGPLDTTVPQLIFQVNVGGQLTALSIPYEPVAHRYMRFRHEAPANAIVFETSPNNIDFTERHRVTLQRSVAALTAELSAGTSNPANPGPAVFDNFGLVTSTFQFSSASYTVGEGGGSILITVTRAGSTAGTATVDYATADGTATQSTRYIVTAGRLTFAPGEASKTFRVLIIDNAQAEGNQNLNLLLRDPMGPGLNTPGRAVLTITDNDTVVPIVNPLDAPTFYVTQHYYDFLNREPDAAGLAFWVNEITSCAGEPSCVERKRINVSAAYFLSIEFQDTGYLVHRFYNLALNRPNGLPRYLEFLRDTQAIGRGVVVNTPGWEALLEANKVAYADEFAARAEFTALYPQTVAPYVDALYAHAGLTPSDAERQAAINEFDNPTGARGRALRRVAENQTLRAREFNRAFVLAQYFGYLRRNPDDPPDNNVAGFNFWLNKLNEFNGDYVAAEMVKSFLVSGEYRNRFGP